MVEMTGFHAFLVQCSGSMKGVLATLLLCLLHSAGDCQWVDVSTEYLLSASCSGSEFGCGLSCADFNGDGLDDLTFAEASGVVSLYERTGDGFELVQALPGNDEDQATSLLWVDVDGDGDLDLFVGRRNQGIQLWIRTATGSLMNQSAARGMPDWPGWRPRGISAADFDRDEDLDIYIASYHIELQPQHYANALLVNDGAGYFTLADDSVGVQNGVQTSFHGGWLDYDRDGWQDLWVINDRYSFPNSLYRNMGDGTFQDVAPELGLDINLDPMTATIFDPDHDGDWDLFSTDVTNIAHQYFIQTDTGFVDMADSAGLAGMDQYGWGSCVVDVDGDTNEDLMIATLHWPSEGAQDNRIYMGQDAGFHFVEDSTGWPNEQLALYHLGRFDLDGDRAPDIVGYGAPPIAQVLQNADLGTGARMTLRLVGTTSNSHAVGALIEVFDEGKRQMQQVDAGADYVTQHSFTRFFGMGSTQAVDSIVVTWPNGTEERWYGIMANAAHVLIQGTSGLEPGWLERTCPWDDQAWSLPTLPGNGEWHWDGAPFAGEVVWAEDNNPHTLVASWWDGDFSISWNLQAEISPFGNPQFSVTPPLCHGDPIWASWSAANVDSVLWMGTDLFPADTAIQVVGDFAEVAWQYGEDCWVDTVVFIVEPDPLLLTMEVDSVRCFGELAAVLAEVSGGTPPFDVDWMGANPGGLDEGVWPVWVTDGAGCQYFDSVIVEVPDSLAPLLLWSYIGDTDSVQLAWEIEGGTPPFEVLWSGPVFGDTLFVAPGTLGWLVQDAQGCLSQGVLQLGVNDVLPNFTGDRAQPLCVRTENLLTFSGPYQEGEISLYDLTGRSWFKGHWATTSSIPIHCPGPILVRVTTRSGQVHSFLR